MSRHTKPKRPFVMLGGRPADIVKDGKVVGQKFSRGGYVVARTQDRRNIDAIVAESGKPCTRPAAESRRAASRKGKRVPDRQALGLMPRKGRSDWNGWRKPGPKPALTKHGAPLHPYLGSKGKEMKAQAEAMAAEAKK